MKYMNTKDKKIEQQEPCWYGRKKYHYVVKRQNKTIYRCTSVLDNQDIVMDILVDRFKGEKNVIHIFRNNSIVMVLNKPSRASKWL